MTSAVHHCAAVVLAAGESSRMGTPKALLDCGGETFLDRIIGNFASCCGLVIVVLGHNPGQIRRGLARGAEAVFAVNPVPDLGMLSSLQTGLAAVPPGCQFVFFHPCDMPLIQPGTLRLLLAALSSASSETRAAVPTLDGRRGHPVLLRSSWIPAFLSLPAGSTARALLESSPASTIEVPVQDTGVRRDFDTRDDYAAAFGVRP